MIPADAGCDSAGDERNGSLHQEPRADDCSPSGDHAAALEELRERGRERDDSERAHRRCLDAQRFPRAEDQGLDGRHGDSDRVGDLGVGPSLELTHDEGRPLVERQAPECPQNADDIRSVSLGNGELLDVVLERHFLHAAAGACVFRSRDVVCDLDQPVLRLLDLDPPLIGAVGVEERRLRDVFRVGRIPEQRERVVIDVFDVAPIQDLEGLISG